ncbi:MAG: hypothetical protein HFJ49_03120 [Clostridia bacterium]|jgi:hypothetical protein|nr:hypothetical protein [Clostridia bacterium]
MQCIHLKIRTKKYEKYIYCKQKKKKIEFKECKTCKYKEYKKIKELKKKSNKLKNLESKRYSILTDNLKVCYICTQKRKDDLHEIFGGSNRIKSMVWGLLIPICRECHQEWKINENMREKYQQEAQKIFEEIHGHELFMTEFKKNVL